MIERRSELVDVIIYDTSVDEYGQKRQDTPTGRKVEMLITDYQQTKLSSEDIRFKDVEYLGLTKDKNIADSNQIQRGRELFNVLGVIPSRRYYQILLKKTSIE